MKAEITRNVLDLALNRCYEASERKSSESITKFSFTEDKLVLTTKGSFTFYEETIPVLKCTEPFTICLKTSNVLEFVKYVSSEKVIIGYSQEKNSCVLSADNKTKLALQTVEQDIQDNSNSIYISEFKLDDANDFSTKLKFASKFCSTNFQDHPLTAIHCSVEKDNFVIKSTCGPSFYQSEIGCTANNPFDFYLHQKAYTIIKNIFANSNFDNCFVNKNHLLMKNDFCSLKIFLESTNTSFPNQVTDWLSKDEDCLVRVSSYELMKSLKFINDIFNNPTVLLKCSDDKLSLECLESNSASKDIINAEKIEGVAESKYSVKLFLDCLESLNTSWLNLHFIMMNEDFYLCKITSDKTITLLCPISS